jgi:hypothetical protein
MTQEVTMAQTATRSKNARAAASTTTTAVPQIEIELGRGGQAIINKAAEARQVRLDAERIEKPLKDKRMQLIEARCEDGVIPDGVKVIVRAMGVVRGVVSWKRNPRTIDMDLLKEGWPEAYEACVIEGDMRPQYDPA